MVDTKAKLTLNGDTVTELDVLKGTLGQGVIDIRTLGSKGALTLGPGFTSTTSYGPKITFIGGDEGILLRRGFLIDQLATDSDYLEICYILLNGEKPTQEQYNEFKAMATRHTMTHEQIIHLLHAFRRDSHLIVIVRGITDALTAFYRDSLDANNSRHREIAAFHLLSKMSTVAAMYYKYSIGQPFVYPRNDLSYAGNFLNMTFSTPCGPYGVNPTPERVMDHILIPHVDHEQDTPTSTVRTAGSSSANPFIYIVTGIASPWRLAHGGTNETAPKMLGRVGSIKHIPELVRRAKGKSDSFHLIGLGYRVYKNYDPRATVICETCREVLKELDTKDDLLGVTMRLENIALDDPYFIEKKLHPNVDFYSDVILKAMGIPSSMLAVISAMVRTADWVAHWSEMHSDGMKIARPRQLYTGYEKRDFKSDTRR